MNNSKVVVILGMHRSGTSVLSNWLHQCGLNLGEKYISLKAGNEKGHFEDLEIYNLHRAILKYNNTNYLVKNEPVLKLPNFFFDEAKNIVNARNQKHSQWGWKEPRTCLFLDMWHKLIPNAKIIVTYRHFGGVVDSLARRQVLAEKIRTNKIIGYYNVITKSKYWKTENQSILLKSWIHHNTKILDFLKLKSKEDYFVVNIDTLLTQSSSLIKFINEKWEIPIIESEYDQIYDDQLMKKQKAHTNVNSLLLKKAENVLSQLRKYHE